MPNIWASLNVPFIHFLLQFFPNSNTYNCLNQLYEFEERGFIDIKGKGEMKTYLLIAKKMVL
jgi:hypothetical protein